MMQISVMMPRVGKNIERKRKASYPKVSLVEATSSTLNSIPTSTINQRTTAPFISPHATKRCKKQGLRHLHQMHLIKKGFTKDLKLLLLLELGELDETLLKKAVSFI